MTLGFTGCHLIAGLGSHEMRLGIRHRGTFEPDANGAVLLTGMVQLANHSRTLGPIGPKTLDLRSWDVESDFLSVMVADEQLVALNALSTRDVELLIDLTVVRLRAPGNVHASATAQLQYRIDAATWSTRLDQIGAAVGLTLRVPTPARTSDSESAGLARIGEHLRAARGHLENHRYPESAASCRHALESLCECEEISEKPTIGALAHGPRKAASESQRWLLLLRATVELANLSHHVTGTAHVRWERTAAESLLVTTAAVVNYYTNPHRPPLPVAAPSPAAAANGEQESGQ